MQREQIIASYVRGKQVLDIGSVGQDIAFLSGALTDRAGEQSQKYSLWNLISKEAKFVIGIDPEAPSEKGEVAGGAVVRGNMEDYQFGRTFEVIVAGDVIEHVSNQGRFLENIHRHLAPEGRLVLTTPNAKWPTVFFKPNETHTLWHDRHTLTHALSRAGFEVERLVYYFGNKPHYSWWLCPLVWRQALLVVAKKRAGHA